jgi:copper resistance protein C
MKRAILSAGISMLAAPPAFAHAYLTRAVPAAGSTVQNPPSQLELFYTEGIVPQFSGVSVRNAQGQPVHTGKMQTAQGGREVIVPVLKLVPGKYRVVWHMTAQDTHKTHGTYFFTVGH